MVEPVPETSRKHLTPPNVIQGQTAPATIMEPRQSYDRVFAGCKYIDQVEQICIDLAKQLFNVDFADVRPISGVCANLVAYTTFTTPGDTILALAIPAGGHISMGKKEFGGTAGAVIQDPLHEGADAMTASTHKTLPGPQGGLILSKPEHGEKIKKSTFPGNVSNHHLHHLAGKAVMFAEMLAFGKEYASQIVKNSRALAAALHEKGF